MMIREDKKILSSSFSAETVPLTGKKIVSMSVEKPVMNLQHGEDMTREQNVITKIIDKLKDVSGAVWLLNSFQKKHTLVGYKARLRWIHESNGMSILLKLSFSYSFFGSGTRNESDLIAELEEINFQLVRNEKRDLQESIERCLHSVFESLKKKNYQEQERRQSEWLRLGFIEIDKLLRKSGFDKRMRVDPDKIEKRSNNRRYILYPAPAACCWNPLGGICITENRYPSNRRPFIGDSAALNRSLDSTKINSYSNIKEESEMSLEKSQDLKAESIFDWDVREEISFVVLKREKEAEHTYYESHKQEYKEQPKHLIGKNKDNVILSYSTRPERLRKVYERYFQQSHRDLQFNRTDKLRVYQVITNSLADENEIIYLTQIIGLRNDMPVWAAVLAHQLSLYPCLLSSPLSTFKYMHIADHLRERILTANDSFGLYLRAFIVENEYGQAQLQEYFTDMHKEIGSRPERSISNIGSYTHLDELLSQETFFSLLRKYLQKQSQPGKQLQAGRHRLQIRKKYRLRRLQVRWIVQEQGKVGFLMRLFPLLIVKDREMQRFQFKQIKRIITTNWKLIIFLRKLNQIVAKVEEDKMAFVSLLLNEYQKSVPDYVRPSRLLNPRRIFLVKCEKCYNVAQTYELQDAYAMIVCQQCKNKENMLLTL